MLKRRSLIRLLDEYKNYRVITICAPAGCGKTVTISQWLSENTRANAIFSLDEYDNNLVSFCERFCASLLACQPKNKTFENILSHPSFQSAPDQFALRAVSALSSRKQTVFVLDDLHIINDKGILNLLAVFVKRLPKNFQVVLISRHEIPAEFSELWLSGHAARIGVEQLLFSNEEIKTLYNKRGNPITQEQVKEINHQTQGWAIGINACLLAGKESFDISLDYLDNFIETNIWRKWDEATREFMLRTAFLRELTPDLCMHMTCMDDCDNFLKVLVQKGAFILQVKKGTYHYHHLFQQFLRRMTEKCGDEFLLPLFEKEGYWHMSQSDYFNAFNCFLRSKSHESIARCFGALVDIGDSDIILPKIMSIAEHPEFVVAAKKYPFMLFMLAFCALAESRANDMVSIMDEYYTRHPEIVEKWPATSYKIIYMFNFDFRVSLEQLSNVFGEVPSTASAVNTSVIRWSATMHMPMLHRAIRDYSELSTSDTTESVRAQIAKTGWMIGEEEPLFHATLTAGLLYEQGQLEKAHEYATNAVACIKNHYTAEKKFCAFSILICVLDALGDTKEADTVLQSALAMIERDKAYYLIQNSNAFIMRRKFAKGDIEAANNWIETHKQISEEPNVWSIYISITSCKAFILVEEYSAAIVLLRKILEIANAFNRIQDVIDIRIMLSIACWKKERKFQSEALEHLEAACLTAYSYGYVQMFINDSAELSGMLRKLQKRVEQREAEDRNHLSFINMLYLKTNNNSDVNPIQGKLEESIKFTDKQKIIMIMICEGKTQREIAQALGIKESTLRYHRESLYSKLKVTNMQDAVKKINTLQLLE